MSKKATKKKKKEEPKVEDIFIEFTAKADIEEAKIVGWICPVCSTIYSPYIKTCTGENDCATVVHKLVQGYTTGGWKLVEKED